jgi:Na+/H+ antiporter NhaC
VLASLADTIPSSLTSKDHVAILIFSTMLGGMVGIISANGGTAAIVKSITKKITNKKTTMFSAFFMGVGIFFDDYANTLIVGNTMRPLFDKFKISREKLAYIVDSTAAPVASLAVISTWIGFEVGVLTDVFQHAGVNFDGYSAFIFSIPYLYYPLITLIFIVFLIAEEKDFGPMLKAEQTVNAKSVKVLKTDEIKTAPPSSPFLAYIPILTVVLITLLSIILTGYKGKFDFREIFGNGDSFSSLIWGSTAGCVIAGLLSLFSKTLNITEVFDSWLDGLKSMMSAVVILTLAWSLSNVCKDVKTADFIMSLLNENFPFWIMPLITFLISAVMSFATGTSWGTMAIVYPLLIPVVLGTEFLHPTIAAVLSGAVFGDHCSPISDTTIMSSMASSCDHINHVRTQLPYALTVALIALFTGYLPIFFGVHPVLSYIAATILVFLTVNFLGQPVKKN